MEHDVLRGKVQSAAILIVIAVPESFTWC